MVAKPEDMSVGEVYTFNKDPDDIVLYLNVTGIRAPLGIMGLDLRQVKQMCAYCGQLIKHHEHGGGS